jgi:pimeloyl-ACP methyl ester carboxylesterase
MPPTAADPASIVASIAARAEVLTTPCGEGRLVWRRFGRGRPMVLAHGGSGSWTHWLKVIPLLEPHYELYAVDLPGLGDSAMPPAPLTPESSGRVLAAGIRTLIPAARRAHLVAFSFGAHVSTFAAAELGNWIASFTISGCAALGLPQGPGVPFPKEASTMSEVEKLAIHRKMLEILMITQPARIDDLAVHLQAMNVRRARLRSRPFARTSEIADNLHRVRAPLRAIWGDKDQTAWPSVERRLEVLATHHPELESRIIADAGHWAMYEQPEAFAAALVELMAPL